MRRERERERERVKERVRETENRERENDKRQKDRKGREGWSVIAYVCGVKTKKLRQPSMSTSWYTCQKQHKERKLTNETRDFEPMQSAALPCVSMVVNL